MSTTQFNPDTDPLEAFIEGFEAVGMKDRLHVMRLILADHPVKPGQPPPRPDSMSPEQHDRFRRAIREAQDWERAYIKEMIRQERQARKQAEEVRS